MRLIRHLLSRLTRSAPTRHYAHVHDIQIKWDGISIGNHGNQDPATMSLNGTCNRAPIDWQSPPPRVA